MKAGDRVRVRPEVVLNEAWVEHRDLLIGVVTRPPAGGWGPSAGPEVSVLLDRAPLGYHRVVVMAASHLEVIE